MMNRERWRKEATRKLELLPLSSKNRAIFLELFPHYFGALERGKSSLEEGTIVLEELMEQVANLENHPPLFSHVYQKESSPFNYHQLGLRFFAQLVNWSSSHFCGHDFVQEISELLKRGEQIILLSNHQTEADPQLFFLAMQRAFGSPSFSEKIYFVGGDRILTDPMALPFSLGCNLFTVYSKKYIANQSLQEREKKQLHNVQTMQVIRDLLCKQEGICLCLFPSGGRDRRSSKGTLLPASLDSESLALFSLLAKRVERNVHFYPMALFTHFLLPPPEKRNREIGEQRIISYSPIGVGVGSSLNSLFSEIENMKEKRGKKRELLTKGVEKALFALYQRVSSPSTGGI